MKLEGTIIEVDGIAKSGRVTIEYAGNTDKLLAYKGKKLTIDVKKQFPKRSLNANSYFHVLCDEIRQCPDVNRSFAYVKNNLITSYGVIERLEDGTSLVYKTNVPPDIMMEREEVHMKYIQPPKNSNDGAYWYRAYKGSHEYNSKEMAKLIDGAIQEAQQLGIDTITDKEKEDMLGRWAQEHQ